MSKEIGFQDFAYELRGRLFGPPLQFVDLHLEIRELLVLVGDLEAMFLVAVPDCLIANLGAFFVKPASNRQFRGALHFFCVTLGGKGSELGLFRRLPFCVGVGQRRFGRLQSRAELFGGGLRAGFDGCGLRLGADASGNLEIDVARRFVCLLNGLQRGNLGLFSPEEFRVLDVRRAPQVGNDVGVFGSDPGGCGLLDRLALGGESSLGVSVGLPAFGLQNRPGQGLAELDGFPALWTLDINSLMFKVLLEP